ncbi:MAG: hypothetical protein NZ941_01180 [Candidatus Caldarchaeum sp.]|nr:hypothetical protein [Candidatus Caldarchaeum sp.]
MQVKKRFYNFRLFGKRKWAQVKQRALELLEAYLQNIEDEQKREKKRRFHLWALSKFEQVWADHLYDSKTKFYLGRILRSIWKFEITHGPNGWHPHWHVLVIGYFPLFVLQAAWIACGGGSVIDMRSARSVESVSEYVAKYEAKPVFELEGEEEQGLSFDLQVSLEASLYGRKLFEVWGLSELLQEEDDGYEFVGIARGVRCELEVDNLHEVPALVRRLGGMSRDGPVMAFLCEAVVSVREYVEGEVVELSTRAGAYLDAEGRIWLVGSERLDEFVSLGLGRCRKSEVAED